MRLPPAWAVGAVAVPPGLASPSRSRRACPPSASSRACARSRTDSQRYIPHAVHRQSCRELLFVFPIIPRLAHQMQYQNSHHRRSEACFRSYTSGNRPKKYCARPCSTTAFEKRNKWNIRLYSPINAGNIAFHFRIGKWNSPPRRRKQKKGRTRQEREALTHFDTLRSVSKISRIHRPPRAIARFSDTLPFFIVCRYFRRIYRLPRTLDTLNTLFFQPTRTEKFFPYIYLYTYFFLSRALVQKKVCQVCQMVVLPDKHGKSTDTLKFSQVCQKSTTFPYSPINWEKF